MEEIQNINDAQRFEFIKKVDFHKATTPVFAEVFNRYPYVWYGQNNLMPNYLIDQYNNCAIHKAIITSKVNQICGDGMVSLNYPMATVNLVNGKENVEEIFRKCALDLTLFGAFALNVVWSQDRESIAEIYHMDVSRLRSGKLDENDEITEFYYSADWTDIKKFKPMRIPSFNQYHDEPSQIYYYKCYQPNNTYYPVPDYSGGLASIEIDVEIKNFHKNNLRKGMVPTLWINFNNGTVPEEEARVLTRALEEQYGGTDNAGSAILSFNESKDTAPEITQITTSQNDHYYTQIYDDINRSILSAHRVSSAELFGIATPGKLGGSNQITEHTEYFRKMIIIPYMNMMLPVFNKLMSMRFGAPVTFDIKPLSIFVLGDVTENTPVVDKPVYPKEV